MFFLATPTEADLIQRLIDWNDLIPMVAICGGLAVGAVAIVFTTLARIVVGGQRERTRREIAAYVAEGTIDPDKAIAMMAAGKSADDASSCC